MFAKNFSNILYQDFLQRVFASNYVDISEKPFKHYFKLTHNQYTNWIIIPFDLNSQTETLITYWIDPIFLSDAINLTFKMFQTKYSYSRVEAEKRLMFLKFITIINNYYIRVDYHFPKLPVSFLNSSNKRESFKALLSKLFSQQYENIFSESFKQNHPTITIRFVNYLEQLLDNSKFINQTDYFKEVQEYIIKKLKRSNKKDVDLNKQLANFNVNLTVNKSMLILTKSTSKTNQNTLKIPVKDKMKHPLLEEVYDINLHSIIKRINYLIHKDA